MSPSQSAYRRGRSTSDIVWAHRWVIARTQKYVDTEIHITGIDISAAFDTVHRHKLLDELVTFLEDEVRICRLLLSNTTITIRNSKVKAKLFKTNLG